MKVILPNEIKLAIDLLENKGFKAYIVGGCVRDAILNKVPSDWDMCTSAKPDEIIETFKDFKIIPTGLKHGTVTAIINHMHIEITTFRIDGEYEDGRRPSSVKFTASVEDDLARRDFTINAMAYNPAEGLIDPFCGESDLTKGILRCVGYAPLRLREDGLRIMRALRFASVLDFEIEEETGKALLECKGLLKNIAGERINLELCKFIVGEGAGKLLLEYREIFAEIMPEIRKSFDFDQRNPHHIYDVWTHTAKSVDQGEKDEIVRLSLCFHDIGKPDTFTLDEEGIGHFYGHGKKSEELARKAMTRLKFDNQRKNLILKLVKVHDTPLLEEKKAVKRLMNKYGDEFYPLLLKVKEGDCKAQAPPFVPQRLEQIKRCQAIYEEIKAEGECFSLADLDINGRDLIEEGYPAGPIIGELLKEALDGVLEEKIMNQKAEILRFLKK